MSEKSLKIEEAYGELNLEMMKEFTDANGISGNEKAATRVMKKWLNDVADEVSYDNLGSLIVTKKGSGLGPKLMVAGHVDEIGFVVRSVDDKGFIKLAPVGGWWGHVLLSQALTITTREGNEIMGIVGSKPPHGMPADVRSKVIDVKDMFLDIGVKDKNEVELLGIRPGDMVTPRSDFNVMANPNYLAAKAWDDRIGAIIAAEVLLRLKGVKHEADIVAVGTVQEEVGLRGAKTATYAVKPDIGIALDVTLANDIPGAEPGSKMGVGVTLAIQDSSHLGHRGFLNYLSDLSKELNLDVQYDLLLAGGTDSGEMHKAFDGIINVTLSIPSRYIHSHRALIHRKDVVDTITLITEFAKRLNWDVLENIRQSNR
jgi:putative aminopeptidase FrvX